MTRSIDHHDHRKDKICYSWTLTYIAFVVTLILLANLLGWGK
jgi:hypothetical protein